MLFSPSERAKFPVLVKEVKLPVLSLTLVVASGSAVFQSTFNESVSNGTVVTKLRVPISLDKLPPRICVIVEGYSKPTDQFVTAALLVFLISSLDSIPLPQDLAME